MKNILDFLEGYEGKAAPWKIGDFEMEGGAGKMNTVFNWKTMIDNRIIVNVNLICGYNYKTLNIS